MNIEDINNMSIEQMKELLIKYVSKENNIKDNRKKKNNEYYRRKNPKINKT